MARSLGTIVRRSLVFGAFALWWGGLTLYALFVIPVAQEVLRSHVRVGFITEKVTTKLNLIGVATLAALLWNALAARKSAGQNSWKWLVGTWVLLALLQSALFFLHPALGRLLDYQAREVIDEPGFYALHRAYLIVTTVQWACALMHFALAIASWRRRDEGVTP